MFVVQQVSETGTGQVWGSAGLLGAILGGGLLASVIAAYRFAVNYRTTERGMRAQAARDRRMAQHEASLWQARCADLEYELRRRGIAVPKAGAELQRLVDAADDDVALPSWDDPERPDERLGR